MYIILGFLCIALFILIYRRVYNAYKEVFNGLYHVSFCGITSGEKSMFSTDVVFTPINTDSIEQHIVFRHSVHSRTLNYISPLIVAYALFCRVFNLPQCSYVLTGIIVCLIGYTIFVALLYPIYQRNYRDAGHWFIALVHFVASFILFFHGYSHNIWTRITGALMAGVYGLCTGFGISKGMTTDMLLLNARKEFGRYPTSAKFLKDLFSLSYRKRSALLTPLLYLLIFRLAFVFSPRIYKAITPFVAILSFIASISREQTLHYSIQALLYLELIAFSFNPKSAYRTKPDEHVKDFSYFLILNSQHLTIIPQLLMHSACLYSIGLICGDKWSEAIGSFLVTLMAIELSVQRPISYQMYPRMGALQIQVN